SAVCRLFLEPQLREDRQQRERANQACRDERGEPPDGALQVASHVRSPCLSVVTVMAAIPHQVAAVARQVAAVLAARPATTAFRPGRTAALRTGAPRDTGSARVPAVSTLGCWAVPGPPGWPASNRSTR